MQRPGGVAVRGDGLLRLSVRAGRALRRLRRGCTLRCGAVRSCPSCGLEPRTREEAAQLRADLAVRWLHPDPENPGLVVRAWHCRACHPRGPVVDVECTRCGDGPIITGVLAADSAPGGVAYPARRWLVTAGWTTAPELVCPEH